ncbi:hypothetical protein ABI59_23005 [Acidobacteria bacterium Mor1]|nr:hypothetical protein ABI59_23005 [Acidobacteria bacterium Mor1]
MQPGFFAPDGPLARALPAFEHRAGQEQMSEAVARTLEGGGTLMVEAGTGTGKTLAYLVPAIRSGRRVVISTGTRNLQDQIFNKDIPFLQQQAGLPVSAALMKGRDNYLCKYRFGQFRQEPLFEVLAEQRYLQTLKAWAVETESGDRAEVAELPDRLRLWRDINARAETCTGSKCPEYQGCWLTQMKARADASQIIVVNHHLFFADLAVRSAFGAVLPEYDSVIFDEAHLLEETATLYFGVQVSANQFEDLARSAERSAHKAGGPEHGGAGAAGLRQAALELFVRLAESQRFQAGRVPLERPDKGGPEVEAEWAVLCEALDEMVRKAPTTLDKPEDADAIVQRCTELRTALERILARDDPGFVYGIETRGKSNLTVSAAPIDVSELLKIKLFDELHGCVLTSATLTVETKFDFFGTRLGLEGAEQMTADSPFDHREQAVLYLPKRMPEPREHAFLERSIQEITSLLRITQGRAFLLFTSYAMMEKVYDELEEINEWVLLRQGEGSKVALVETFKDTPGAVLLGTTSFWHGVDVQGDALSLVVIDKLPYDVPSDPLVAARIQRIKDEGGNPFRDYQTPMAVLELKQGLGRLLRSRADRGILCVLDPRLTTRSYGRTFLRSLPPYRIVRERTDCRAFFEEGS